MTDQPAAVDVRSIRIRERYRTSRIAGRPPGCRHEGPRWMRALDCDPGARPRGVAPSRRLLGACYRCRACCRPVAARTKHAIAGAMRGLPDARTRALSAANQPIEPTSVDWLCVWLRPEQLPLPGQAFERTIASVREAETGSDDKILHRSSHEHLAGRGERADAGGDVDGES